MFFVLLNTGHAAEVKNITSGQSGERGFVQYDLVGKLGEKEADVTVFLEIGGERYPAGKLSLSGDFGVKVKIGTGKRFYWDFLKDFPAGFDGEVSWDVEASGGAPAAVAPVPEASSGSRIALVIGNASYKNAPLKKALNDANDVAAALREIGFSVTLKTDAGQDEMEHTIEAFTRKIRKDVTTLFYFAGHGVQVDGRYFLLPVGKEIKSVIDVKTRSVEVTVILEKIVERGGRANFFFFDTSRSNPFVGSSNSIQKNLNAPKNSIIAFATADGKDALDNSGRNGMFTKHLLLWIKTPGIDIEKMLNRVRLGVTQETRGAQVPDISGNLSIDDLQLNPK